ncbi:hypothetical protein [Amycolatopsis sp. La24]|uniref:hypothetical protein n=1 Tax=Amycolatopsis sp. La24 TaxID=3028304 RepID=UPI0023B014E1|nr:hypothetical protein [Amycolatopsis sp. La24]
MTTSNPWWGSGLFTVAGVLITTLGASVLAILNRRTERRRLSREQKVETYPELLYAAHRLARTPVWPADAGDPEELRDEIDKAAQRVRLFAPASVGDAVAGLLTAADSFAQTVRTIRTESKPAHADLLDQRDAAKHRETVEGLRTATEAFLAATRVDLEVDRA